MSETPVLCEQASTAGHTPGPYVVRNGSEIWKQPAGRLSPDGASMTYSLSFKVCEGIPEYVGAVPEYVGGVGASGVGFRGAFAIAELLNRGHHFDQLLEALENLENDAGQIPKAAWRMVQSALREAKGGEA